MESRIDGKAMLDAIVENEFEKFPNGKELLTILHKYGVFGISALQFALDLYSIFGVEE